MYYELGIMNKAFKKFAFVYAVLLIAVSFALSPSSKNLYNKKIIIAGKTLWVQIAASNADMRKGLSGRESLKDDQGMLFNFKNEQRPSIWMKDMKFDLDIIWIRQNKVVGLTLNAKAPRSGHEKLTLYQPEFNIDMALEVNSGWAIKNNIAVGDEVYVEQN